MDIFLMHYFCRMLLCVVWGVTFRPLNKTTVLHRVPFKTPGGSGAGGGGQRRQQNNSVLLMLVLGRWRKMDLWVLLIRKTSIVGEFQASEKPFLRKQPGWHLRNGT